MKRFLVRVTVFFACFFLLTYVMYYLDIYTYLLPNKTIYEVIRQSKEKNDKVKTLIIGDSVGKQLFNSAYNDDSDTIKSLASNQAIDIIGQYLILKNYLDINPQVKKVYLVYNPFSFSNNLDHKFTFNYFLKPFYKPEFIPLISREAMAQIEKIPFYQFANFPPVAITFWTPEVYQDSLSEEKFLSEVSVEYLRKMKALTDQKNIDFQVVPPPVKMSLQEELEALLKNREIDKYPELHTALFHDYFDKVFYLPDSLYVDRKHFKNPEKFREFVMEKTF